MCFSLLFVLYVSVCRSIAIIKALVAHSPSIVSIVDHNGCSALAYAARFGQAEAVRCLASVGGKIEEPCTAKGEYVWDLARAHGHHDLAVLAAEMAGVDLSSERAAKRRSKGRERRRAADSRAARLELSPAAGEESTRAEGLRELVTHLGHDTAEGMSKARAILTRNPHLVFESSIKRGLTALHLVVSRCKEHAKEGVELLVGLRADVNARCKQG